MDARVGVLPVMESEASLHPRCLPELVLKVQCSQQEVSSPLQRSEQLEHGDVAQSQ
jgi:hypothetical protein